MATETQILDLLTPSVEDFATWRGYTSVEEFDAPLQNVATHLRLSASLLYLATGLTEVPASTTALGALLRAAVFDMAWYIGTSIENRDEEFSPFSSERIGSYSYSKSMRAVSKNESTGVPLFDMAVTWFARSLLQSSAMTEFALSSEHVFKQPYGKEYAAAQPGVLVIDAINEIDLDLVEAEDGLYYLP